MTMTTRGRSPSPCPGEADGNVRPFHRPARGSIKACERYLLAVQDLHGEHLRKAQSAHRRVAKGLTPAQAEEVARFVRDWKAKITPNKIGAHAIEEGRRL